MRDANSLPMLIFITQLIEKLSTRWGFNVKTREIYIKIKYEHTSSIHNVHCSIQ